MGLEKAVRILLYQVREAFTFTSVSKNSNRYYIYLWKTARFARLFCLHIQEESGA